MDLDRVKKLLTGKNLIFVVGGGVALFLLYRYFVAGRSSGGQTQPTPDQTGLTAAEQVGAQEAADVSQLQSDIGGLQGTIDQLTSDIEGLMDGNGSPEDQAGGAVVVKRKKTTKRKPKKGVRKPKPAHPKGHQSGRKHAGSGAVAPSHHGPKRRPTKKPKPKVKIGILPAAIGPPTPASVSSVAAAAARPKKKKKR